jgi:nucleotidyltransferase substrate binding protein (TIGR01987 family)
VIQRFEFTFELLWKTLKQALLILWIERNSPREVLIESFKQWLIDDLEFFLLLKDVRNQTSHTYEENLARDIYEFIIKNYSKIYDPIMKLIRFKNDLQNF